MVSAAFSPFSVFSDSAVAVSCAAAVLAGASAFSASPLVLVVSAASFSVAAFSAASFSAASLASRRSSLAFSSASFFSLSACWCFSSIILSRAAVSIGLAAPKGLALESDVREGDMTPGASETVRLARLSFGRPPVAAGAAGASAGEDGASLAGRDGAGD